MRAIGKPFKNLLIRCHIRVSNVEVQSLSRPDLLGFFVFCFYPHPAHKYQICRAFPGWKKQIPNPVSHITYPSGIFSFSRISPNVCFGTPEHRNRSSIHDEYYDNQFFLEISRTPQAIFVVSLSKVSSTVVSAALANFASSGSYLNLLE